MLQDSTLIGHYFCLADFLSTEFRHKFDTNLRKKRHKNVQPQELPSSGHLRTRPLGRLSRGCREPLLILNIINDMIIKAIQQI